MLLFVFNFNLTFSKLWFPLISKDDVPSRYADPGQGVRHSRARLDYDIPSGSSQYGDSYGDRSVSA